MGFLKSQKAQESYRQFGDVLYAYLRRPGEKTGYCTLDALDIK